MNYVKAGIFFIVCWLIQTTLLWRIWPFAAAPSLLLCAVVCFSWLYDEFYCLAYAAVFGLMLDLQVQSLFGVSGVALVLSCIPAFLLRTQFNPERTLPVVVSALVATPINVLTVWGINHIFRAPMSIVLVLRTLPELFVSQALICLVLHLLFVRTIIKDRKDRRFVGGVL